MTIDTLVMFSGAFIVILPHLGFPQSWDTVLLSLVGVFVIALGIVVRRRGLKPREQSRDREAFPASTPVPSDEMAQ